MLYFTKYPFADGKTTPELITDGPHSALSKRIIVEFPDYEKAKPSHLPTLVEIAMIHSLDPLFKVPGFQVELLQPEDTAALQALLEKCADYSQLVTGSPPGPSSSTRLKVASVEEPTGWS